MSDSDQHDDEFEAYLKRRVPIDQSMGPPERLEPPPELDRIVISNARKAIETPAPIRPYRAPRWAFPMGLAATLLIATAVLLDLGLRAHKFRIPLMEIDASITAPAAAVVAPAPSIAIPTPAIPVKPWAPTRHKLARMAVPAAPVPTSSDAIEQVVRANTRSRNARIEVAELRDAPDPAAPTARAAIPAPADEAATMTESASPAAPAPPAQIPTPRPDAADDRAQ